MSVFIPILAGLGCGAMLSRNPRRRRTTKRRSARRRTTKRLSPAKARKAARLEARAAKLYKKRLFPGAVAYTIADRLIDEARALRGLPAWADRHKTNPVKLGRVQFRHGQLGGPYYTATAKLGGQQYDGYAPGKLGRKKARAHLLAEARKHFNSNPGKRRKGKRKGKWVSPGSAASRLAWWRWHSNPKPRDLTEHEFTRGAAHVTIATWRNKNATAFIAVTARGPGGVKTWEAKSQGPSAGGYSKPTQAAERMYHKLTGRWVNWGGSGDREMNAIAQIAAELVGGPKSDWTLSHTNPRRRRKSRRR